MDKWRSLLQNVADIDLENYLIPIIVVGGICVGYVLKKWLPTDDKWIPTILLFLGAISGAILFGLDYEGVVKGMLSGLASVGLHLSSVGSHFFRMWLSV